MKAPIKTFACSAIISIIFFACGETDNNSQEQCSTSVIGIGQISSSSSIWEKPVMDSRAFYKREISYEFGEPSDYYKNLGDFNGIKIRIVTDKNILMPVFSHIFDNEQTECNYFAIYITYPSQTYDDWVLSQDMVLHQIVPATLTGCVYPAIPPIPYTDAMLVCDDTAEGNLKDKIDLDSIRSQADPNWRCSGYAEVHVNCK